MTTALIGKQTALGGKVCVAWVSRHANPTLAALLGHGTHELRECSSWDEFAAVAQSAVVDLVLCDAEVAAVRPQLAVPTYVVGEASRDNGGLRAIAPAALEATFEVLVDLASRVAATSQRCRELEGLVGGIRTGQALVGNSPLMRRLATTLSRAADCDATVLIEGPAGVGKSLAARVIHCKSRRVGQPLVAAACAAMSAEELARTIEAAKLTTLVLEDVDQLSAPAQAQLVRHLKERNARNPATRLIVTTSAHLPELVAKGAFREDLLYRLHAFPIVVPALRERTEDIAAIATSYLDSCTLTAGSGSAHFTPSALMLLESMSWPGNITQLEAAVWRARLAAGGGAIDREHLLISPATHATAATSAAPAERGDEVTGELSEDSIRPFEEEEQMLLSRALRATKGNVRRAAQLLGIGRATLYRKIQQYRLRLQ